MASPSLTTPIREAPFDAVADSYDAVFTESLIGRAQRLAVWRAMDRAFRPGQRILEINCGTGVDAIHLASRGVEVLACDSSPRMIEIARARLARSRMPARVEFRVLETEQIAALEGERPFDGLLSNFGGLNCVALLSPVASDLAMLLKPGASALMAVFGRFSVWETFWYLATGDTRKAFRRFQGGPTTARLAEGTTVEVHYPSVRELVRRFSPAFRLRHRQGVGVAVPPSYLEPQARRFPKALGALEFADRFLGRCPVLRGMADHVLITFERVNE